MTIDAATDANVDHASRRCRDVTNPVGLTAILGVVGVAVWAWARHGAQNVGVIAIAGIALAAGMFGLAVAIGCIPNRSNPVWREVWQRWRRRPHCCQHCRSRAKSKASGQHSPTSSRRVARAITPVVGRITEGETVVDPTIVSKLMGRRRRPWSLNRLTPREHEVLALVAEGMSNQAIGLRLGVSERTIDAHIAQIFQKLGLDISTATHRRVLAALTYLRTTG